MTSQSHHRRALDLFAALLLLLAVLAPAAAAAEPQVTAEDEAARSVHMRLDADMSWGIGSQMFLGAQVHLLTHFPIWQSRLATGSVDVSLRMAYSNEPVFLAPWREANDGVELNRLQAQVGLGHTFHMSRTRRVALGVHLLLGWNHYVQYAQVDWPEVDVQGEGRSRYDDLLVSGELALAVRLHERVGLNLAIDAPFPTTSNYLITMVQVSLGLSVYLF